MSVFLIILWMELQAAEKYMIIQAGVIFVGDVSFKYGYILHSCMMFKLVRDLKTYALN